MELDHFIPSCCYGLHEFDTLWMVTFRQIREFTTYAFSWNYYWYRLNSVSTFMRKLLAPSEFDILQARLFGSVNHADPAYFPIVIPMIIIVAVLILLILRI